MPPTTVTEKGVTVTANAPEAEIRASAGFAPATEIEPKQVEPEPSPDPAPTPPPEPPEPDPDPDLRIADGDQPRNDDGTFKEKTKDPAGDPRRSIQAKINYERKLRADAERRAADLEVRLAERTRPAEATPDEPNAPTYAQLVKRYQADPLFPKLDEFLDQGFEDPYAGYNAAVAVFLQDRRMAEREHWLRQQDADAEFTRRASTAAEAGAEKYADWHDLLQSDAAQMNLPGVVIQELYEDPSISADLIHHLLTHPDDVARLAAVHPKDPIAAARAVAKLASVASPASSGPASPSPSVTRAKPLIKPVKTSPAAPEAKSLEDMPFGPSYVKAVARHEREQREQRRGG